MLTVRDYVTADGPIARCAKYGKLCSGFVENLKGLVGAEGFEPPTLCSQSRCATRLRYAPMTFIDCISFLVGHKSGQLLVQQPSDQPQNQQHGNCKDHAENGDQEQKEDPVAARVPARFAEVEC